MILAIDQPNAPILVFIISLLYPSTCFEHYCAHIGRSNCVIQHQVSSHSVGGCPVRRLIEDSQPPTQCDDTRSFIIQFDLLMMRKTVLEICRGIQKIYYKKRICVLTWSVTKIILKCTVSKTSKFVEVGLAAVLP